MPDRSTIPPRGVAYRIRMATIGHWHDEGVMDEEYLFWDSQEFLRQIGPGNQQQHRQFQDQGDET